ncbi:MAG: AraC family transcriptional regulator [Myxococcales bacterium]|nr:AraC family transcriptional regulator [Myxococcales bacterium]
MRVFAPCPALAPYVRELMVVEVHEDVTRLRLPEPSLVLGVRYRGAASLVGGPEVSRLPDATITGVANMARRMRTEGGSGVVLARFHPGGAAALFPQPLHELFGAIAALDELVAAHDVERVRSQVAEARDGAARARALEAFLVARRRTRAPDPVVAAAVRLLSDAHGVVRIGALARSLGISQDPLEKRFRRAVGATPKQLASLLRLRRAIEAYRPGVTMTELAFAAGYFDQSHLSRQLRAATGEPPGKFFRAGEHR